MPRMLPDDEHKNAKCRTMGKPGQKGGRTKNAPQTREFSSCETGEPARTRLTKLHATGKLAIWQECETGNENEKSTQGISLTETHQKADQHPRPGGNQDCAP